MHKLLYTLGKSEKLDRSRWRGVCPRKDTGGSPALGALQSCLPVGRRQTEERTLASAWPRSALSPRFPAHLGHIPCRPLSPITGLQTRAQWCPWGWSPWIPCDFLGKHFPRVTGREPWQPGPVPTAGPRGPGAVLLTTHHHPAGLLPARRGPGAEGRQAAPGEAATQPAAFSHRDPALSVCPALT